MKIRCCSNRYFQSMLLYVVLHYPRASRWFPAGKCVSINTRTPRRASHVHWSTRMVGMENPLPTIVSYTTDSIIGGTHTSVSSVNRTRGLKIFSLALYRLSYRDDAPKGTTYNIQPLHNSTYFTLPTYKQLKYTEIWRKYIREFIKNHLRRKKPHMDGYFRVEILIIGVRMEQVSLPWILIKNANKDVHISWSSMSSYTVQSLSQSEKYQAYLRFIHSTTWLFIQPWRW